MRRVSVYALSLAALLLSLPTESIVSARDRLIWEDQFDLAGRTDRAFGITVSSGMAVAIGVGGTASGGSDLLMRAYNVRTGTLEWQDQRPLASGFITTVVIDDGARNVFGAGYAANGSGTDFLVRAYDARTGDLLWEDVVDKGRDDFVQDIAAGQEGVFVVGYGGNTGGSAVGLLVRAYDKGTGNLLWEDQVDHGGQEVAAWQVETEGGLVLVAGSIRGGPDEQEMMLRAYDASTGHLVWDSHLPMASPNVLAVDADRVYVGGSAVGSEGAASAFLAAYDLHAGLLLWQAAASDVIRDLAVGGSQLFAAGGGTSLLRSYDVATGVLNWEDQTGSSNGQVDLALGVDVGPDLVFVAGQRSVPFEYSEFLVRAYDPTSGELVWEDSSHRSNSSFASGIAMKGQRVFAVGGAGKASSIDTDFLIRAYSDG